MFDNKRQEHLLRKIKRFNKEPSHVNCLNSSPRPNQKINFHFPECKTLPWPMMRLDPTFSFPIKSGTHVPIVCPDPGYIQTGDSTVYCEGGSVFHFENLPACIGGRDEQHESWGYVTWNLGHVTLLMSRSSFCKIPWWQSRALLSLLGRPSFNLSLSFTIITYPQYTIYKRMLY